MTHDQIADALWESLQRGVHDPVELHGVIPSIDDAYRLVTYWNPGLLSAHGLGVAAARRCHTGGTK